MLAAGSFGFPCPIWSRGSCRAQQRVHCGDGDRIIGVTQGRQLGAPLWQENDKNRCLFSREETGSFSLQPIKTVFSF